MGEKKRRESDPLRGPHDPTRFLGILQWFSIGFPTNLTDLPCPIIISPFTLPFGEEPTVGVPKPRPLNLPFLQTPP